MPHHADAPSRPSFPADNRRGDDRLPLALFLNQYVEERLQRVVTSNLSPTGMHVHRVYNPRKPQAPFSREHRFVQVELALPGTGETIWARGEVRHDELVLTDGVSAAPLVHGTGILLRDMARGHRRLLMDWLEEERRGRRADELGRAISTVRGLIRATCLH
jgi:hypothetical protein